MDFKYQLALSLQTATNLPLEDILSAIEVPKDTANGDFAFPCFKLAKELKKAPPVIAKELADQLTGQIACVTQIEQAGAYLNFTLDKTVFAKVVMEALYQKGESFGSDTLGQGKTVVIDYSSPNIAKPFHVGHLRSTMIGNALYNIHNFLGYTTVGVNHLGDWGTQFGKLIVAYKNWSSEAAVREGKIAELNRIYVKFHDEAKTQPELEDEGRAWMLKMQEGDKEALDIWTFFRDMSLEEFEVMYTRLGVTFDHYTGESFYNDKMDAPLAELAEKGLLVESDGAKIVMLDEFDLAPCLLLRKDGGTLYHTRDLAAAFYRKHTFDFHKALYVTALDQSLHFTQLFKVIGKMGHDWANNMAHVPFGLVSLEDGKLSTRSGRVVLMQDLLDEAEAHALSIINEKNPELPNKDQVAKDVGIGAIVFNDLYNTRIKDVVFSLSKMLNFDGETGPMVQYTHVRTCSLLEKGSAIDFGQVDYALLTDDASNEVLTHLYFYPETIKTAAEKNEPYLIARQLVAISQSFNRFYHHNPILSSDDATKNARLALVHHVGAVLRSGLKLLGVNAPAHM